MNPYNIRDFDWLPNINQILHVSNENIVRIWDSKMQEYRDILEIRENNTKIRNLKFFPDGKRFLFLELQSGNLKIWDLQTSTEKIIMKGIPQYSSVKNAVSKNGRYIAIKYTAIEFNYIHIFDLENKTERKITTTHSPYTNIVFSSDSKYIAFLNEERELNIVNLETGVKKHICTIREDSCCCIDWSNKFIVIGDMKGNIHLYDISLVMDMKDPISDYIGCKIIGKHEKQYGYNAVYSVMFSPDGDKIVSSSQEDMKIWVLDIPDNQNLSNLEIHSKTINGINRMAKWNFDASKIAVLSNGDIYIENDISQSRKEIIKMELRKHTLSTFNPDPLSEIIYEYSHRLGSTFELVVLSHPNGNWDWVELSRKMSIDFIREHENLPWIGIDK